MLRATFSRTLIAYTCATALLAGCGEEDGPADSDSSQDAGADASENARGDASEDTSEASDDAGTDEEDAAEATDASEDEADGGSTDQDASTGGDELGDDDGELDGQNGASGTVNGMTYTFTENVSWFYPMGNVAAYQALVRNWEIYGIPREVGSYSCNSDGMMPRIRLILGYQYYTTTDGGSCTLEVVSVSETHIEGRFSAELVSAFAPNDAFGSVTGGVFRKRD